MRNSWLIRCAVAVLCSVALTATALAPLAVSANDEDVVPLDDEMVPVPGNDEMADPSEIEDILEAHPKFPALEGPADTTFLFEIEFTYRSGEALGQSFDLSITGPTDWLTYVAESTYDVEKQISAIFLEPYTVKQPIVVVAVAPFWLYPEPGEYPIELRISGGGLEDVANLTATITPRYELDAETATGYETAATTAGSETTLGVNVVNSGTARMENVILSASTPPEVNNEAWEVTFEPERVVDLPPGAKAEVQVSITPPADVEPGDYMTTLEFDAQPALSAAPPAVPIRVSVAGHTAWGFVLALLVVVLAGAIALGYRKYGRKKA